MGWFKRLQDGIKTATVNKKEAPEGIWFKCPKCSETSTMKEFRDNFHKCPKCDYKRLKTWNELSDDEKIIVKVKHSEYSLAARKRHRFCVRCGFEEVVGEMRA